MIEVSYTALIIALTGIAGGVVALGGLFSMLVFGIKGNWVKGDLAYKFFAAGGITLFICISVIHLWFVK